MNLGKFIAALHCIVLCFASAFAGNPAFTNDAYGFPQWDDGNGNKWVIWGVEADLWSCQAGNTSLFHDHCDASNYINANCIFIPATWKMIEPAKDSYTSWYLKNYIDMAYAHGLKAIIMWVGANWACGDSSFTPDYILNDTATYGRVVGLDNDSELCPSNPNTRSREAAAYAWMMNWLKTYNTQKGNIVLGTGVGSELDYMRALNTAYHDPSHEDHSRRCTCSHCNAQYQSGEDIVNFMSRMFGNYIKAIVDAGAANYDIPTYTPLAAHKYWPGWRYAEQPDRWKAIVNKANHLVCPSVAETSSATAFVTEEMDYFTSSQIPGNRIFVEGIDTGWTQNQAHIEMAPWYSILWYGSLGAGYWDNPYVSVRTDAGLREKLRKFWGPLLAMHYWLARNKAAGHGAKFYWQYGETHTWQSLKNYAVDQVSTDQDYGVCFQLDANTVTFTGSTYGGPYTITISHADGWSGYKFERGYYHPRTGTWIRFDSVAPNISGNNATLTVSNDSGDYIKAVYRYYRLLIPGDLNEDGKVDHKDLLILCSHWLDGF